MPSLQAAFQYTSELSSKARKTQVRFVSNANAFEVKRTCVFSKMYLCFGENAKAFGFKHFGVLK